jgi:hypothetical protein
VWALKALLLGVAAFALVLYAAAAAIGVTADVRGWRTFEVELGPLPLLSFEREGASTSFELGVGLFVLALAGGLANLLAAALVRRRTP